MICCAVGICAITDLELRIEQRADVELASIESSSTLRPIASALVKPICFTERNSISSMI
jgi:hypothetical protein